MDFFSILGGLASLYALIFKDSYLVYEGTTFYNPQIKISYKIPNKSKSFVEFKSEEIIPLIDGWFNYKLFSLWNKVFRRFFIPLMSLLVFLQLISFGFSKIPYSGNTWNDVCNKLGLFIYIIGFATLILFLILHKIIRNHRKNN